MISERLPLKRINFFGLLWLSIACSLKLGAVAANPQPSVSRPVTVADSIEMTRWGDRLYDYGGSAAGRVAQFSPDGAHFAVIVRKGNIASNTNDYTVLLWETGGPKLAHARRQLITMSSSSNHPAIEQLTWIDNQTIAFLGERPGQPRQLYSFNIHHNKLAQLTNHPTNLLAYGISSVTREVAYVAEQPTESVFDMKAKREGLVVTTQHFSGLLVEGKKGGQYYGDYLLFLQSRKAGARELPLKIPDSRISISKSTPFISPNGRYIVIAADISRIPPEWAEYQDWLVAHEIKQTFSDGQFSQLQRLVLFDTRTGSARVLVDAPLSSFGTVCSWAPDSRHIAIAGAILPLGGISTDERQSRRSNTFIAEVDVEDGKIQPVLVEQAIDSRFIQEKWSGFIKRITWREGGEIVFDAATTTGDGNTYHVSFSKRADKWYRSDLSAGDDRPVVELREDMSNPPRLYIRRSGSSSRQLLEDLNPQFNHLLFGRIEEIKWSWAKDQEAKGGLYYPVHYVTGTRYPLVIQTHGWSSEKFWIDGPWSTAFAAQALAGKDIMVLQVDESFAHSNTLQEITDNVAIIEHAIDHLDELGLIDTNRVGIIGFSRSCLFVKYALSHPHFRFAAASVSDGVDAGYFQYLLSVTFSPLGALTYEGINGGLPYGATLKNWLERSPSFSLDNVTTPTRITALTRGSALSEWEWFAGLSRLGKPVDMIIIENGEHILQRPWDRLISQQGNVDWFTFWLKQEEDPDPAKFAQYSRWKKLRRTQQAHAQSEHLLAPSR